MKRHFFFLISVVFSLENYAGPIGQEQAREIAREFMNKTESVINGKRKAPAREYFKYKEMGYKHLWTFANEVNGGFVIVGDNDGVDPVLAYSETGSLDMSSVSDALKDMLASFEQQLAQLPANQASSARRAPAKREAIKPLIKTVWHQYPPYDCLTPYSSSLKHNMLVGCVAVTMAQLMYYYHYPAGTTKEIPAYTSETNKYEMKALPPTTFDYDKMHHSYGHFLYDEEYDKSDPSIQEVAKLLLYCGCAVEMDYTNFGSAANFNVQKFADYFGYDRGAQFRFAANYSSDVWEEMVYNELAVGRPVPYSAGAVLNQNHQFIVDGYDGNGFFHMNEGGVGSFDSNDIYTKLSVLDTYYEQDGAVAFSGYNVHQSAYFGFQPDKGGTAVEGETYPNITSEGVTVDKVTFCAAYEGERLRAHIDCTNNTTNQENLILLWIDDNPAGGRGLYLDPSTSGQTIIFAAAPERGTHKVKLTSDWEGKNILYEGNLNITEAPEMDLKWETEYEGIKNYVVKDCITVKHTITNVGKNRFDGFLYSFLYAQQVDENMEYIEDLTTGYPSSIRNHHVFLDLQPGESQNIEFKFDGYDMEPGLDMIYSAGSHLYKYKNKYDHASSYIFVYGATRPITEVGLNTTYVIFDKVGDTFQLVASVIPEYYTDTSVTWSSSDNSVCTVSDEGLITSVGRGTATITVTSVDGGKQNTCGVEVRLEDGIVEAGENVSIRAIYDVAGRKAENQLRGLNILEMNDGTKKKVVVK